MGMPLAEQNITYVLETDGKLVVIENVPARVSEETGEQFFSPETVEWLYKRSGMKSGRCAYWKRRSKKPP